MATATKILRAPHGIVFLFDPKMDVDIPPDTGAGPILYTDNCVSLWTIHEDDGKVELTITDEESRHGLTLRFDGRLRTESGRIAWNDSSANEIVTVPSPIGHIRVRIFTNHEIDPDKVLCVIG